MIQIWYQSSTWWSWPPGKLPLSSPKIQRLIIPCWITTMHVQLYFMAISGHSEMLLPMLPHYLIAISISLHEHVQISTQPHGGVSWFHYVAKTKGRWVTSSKMVPSLLKAEIQPLLPWALEMCWAGLLQTLDQNPMVSNPTSNPSDTSSNMINYDSLGGWTLLIFFQVIWWPFLGPQWDKPSFPRPGCLWPWSDVLRVCFSGDACTSISFGLGVPQVGMVPRFHALLTHGRSPTEFLGGPILKFQLIVVSYYMKLTLLILPTIHCDWWGYCEPIQLVDPGQSHPGQSHPSRACGFGARFQDL